MIFIHANIKYIEFVDDFVLPYPSEARMMFSAVCIILISPDMASRNNLKTYSFASNENFEQLFILMFYIYIDERIYKALRPYKRLKILCKAKHIKYSKLANNIVGCIIIYYNRWAPKLPQRFYKLEPASINLKLLYLTYLFKTMIKLFRWVGFEYGGLL